MEGVRILEVADYVFVPSASAVLADWGADVIKIEHPERGDSCRGFVSTPGETGDINVLYENSNRGKRSIGLNLADPRGVEVLYRLAGTCDVFLTSRLPAVRKRHKYDVDDLREHNPGLIYVRGSGTGTLGPGADDGGFDALCFWYRSGAAISLLPAGVDRPLWMPGPAYGDLTGGMTIAGGIASALFHRERTGEALVVDVSLMNTGLWSMGATIATSLHAGQAYRVQDRERARITNPLVGVFQTQDGEWLALCCIQGFRFWGDACRVFGHPELVSDGRFSTPENFRSNAPEGARILAETIGQRPLAYWRDRLAGFKGQWTVVSDPLQSGEDVEAIANHYVVESSTSAGQSYRVITTPVQFDNQAAIPRRSPQFNEHSWAILEELGMESDEILELQIAGVLT
jgi:crotonobetainyl-CoA:carnitine CoA-transferase CaiB-like acyl-CoA transferase